jgi:hypothetical protein
MFPRLQRACFHPPSKLGGIQQAFFINSNESISKNQTKSFWSLDIGAWDFFGIWDLEFGI